MITIEVLFFVFPILNLVALFAGMFLQYEDSCYLVTKKPPLTILGLILPVFYIGYYFTPSIKYTLGLLWNILTYEIYTPKK